MSEYNYYSKYKCSCGMEFSKVTKDIQNTTKCWCGEQATLDRYNEIGEYSSVSTNKTVIEDIKPYKSMLTGEMISSRSKHRTHLRDHNVVEVGNEIKAATTMPKKAEINWKPEIIRQVHLAKEAQRRKG